MNSRGRVLQDAPLRREFLEPVLARLTTPEQLISRHQLLTMKKITYFILNVNNLFILYIDNI